MNKHTAIRLALGATVAAATMLGAAAPAQAGNECNPKAVCAFIDDGRAEVNGTGWLWVWGGSRSVVAFVVLADGSRPEPLGASIGQARSTTYPKRIQKVKVCRGVPELQPCSNWVSK